MRAKLLQAVSLLLCVYATHGQKLPCPYDRSECSRTPTEWVCEANYALTSRETCEKSPSSGEISCNSSRYIPVTTATAPALVAARTAAALKIVLQAVISGDEVFSPYLAKAEVEEARAERADGDFFPRCAPDMKSLTTAGSLVYDEKFRPWGCPPGFQGPGGGGFTSVPEGFYPRSNPLWCSYSLEGKNRVPVKASVFVNGSGSLWRAAIRAALEYITDTYTGQWKNIFKHKKTGKPKIKIVKKGCGTYIVFLFFKKRYLEEAQTICT